ncbi:MAG: DUF5818 domain-containing protein [Gemmatimonadota bacterium]
MIRRTIRTGFLAAGVALTACGGNNGGAEPRTDPEPRPDPAPGELTISISPQQGTHGTEVAVRANGFEPGARVGIGIGPPQSEYEVFAHATADADGTVTTTVQVPDWTEPGRDYLFAAVGPDGRDVISSAFQVTGGEGAETIRVVGELTGEGVECPALRADDGTLYTLAGDIGDFGEGDRVEVEGTTAEASFCMQGTTIQVETIRPASGR